MENRGDKVQLSKSKNKSLVWIINWNNSYKGYTKFNEGVGVHISQMQCALYKQNKSFKPFLQQNPPCEQSLNTTYSMISAPISSIVVRQSTPQLNYHSLLY